MWNLDYFTAEGCGSDICWPTFTLGADSSSASLLHSFSVLTYFEFIIFLFFSFFSCPIMSIYFRFYYLPPLLADCISFSERFTFFSFFFFNSDRSTLPPSLFPHFHTCLVLIVYLSIKNNLFCGEHFSFTLWKLVPPIEHTSYIHVEVVPTFFTSYKCSIKSEI